MPFGSEGVEPGIGLALSGGGFRATLFHCGALWRLNDLGVLARLDRISSVSGGSITAGVLATKPMFPRSRSSGQVHPADVYYWRRKTVAPARRRFEGASRINSLYSTQEDQP